MLRPTALATLLLATALGAACGEEETTSTPTTPTPVAVNEAFSDTLNPNGGRTHPFVVERAGEVTATITVIEADPVPDPIPTVGLSLGTWNGIACQAILANDTAAVGQTLVGSATSIGQFCVRIFDNGRLTGNINYSITVTHF